jgi:hypothetical protein
VKTCLILEDTPKGLRYKLIWQPNDYQDHAADSVAMMIQHNLSLHLRELQVKKLLRIMEESGETTSTPSR